MKYLFLVATLLTAAPSFCKTVTLQIPPVFSEETQFFANFDGSVTVHHPVLNVNGGLYDIYFESQESPTLVGICHLLGRRFVTAENHRIYSTMNPRPTVFLTASGAISGLGRSVIGSLSIVCR